MGTLVAAALATGVRGARAVIGGAMFVAILGDRQATLPAGWTNETAVALAAGDLVVRVPPGSRVRESGFSLLGDRRIEVARAAATRSRSRSTACSAT